MSKDPLCEQTERFAQDFLDRARADIAHAENKASILLAGILAAVGGVTAAISAAKWRVIRQPPYVTVPFWGAVATIVAAIICLICAVYPRTAPRARARPGLVAFFGDVIDLESPVELHELLSASAARLIDILVDQIWQVSAIAVHKYRYVRWSVRLLGCTVYLAVIAEIGAAVHAS